jgi:hypothetical protein
VRALLHPVKEIHPHVVAWRAIKQWFMRPIASGETQKMFKRGHRNEPILKKLLPNWLQLQTSSMSIEWNVRHIIDVGLLESVKSPFICGSPDGVGRVFANGSLNRECDVTGERGARCAIECKTMSKAHTAQEQKCSLVMDWNW